MGGSVVLRHAALRRARDRDRPDAVVSVSAAGFWFYKGTPPMRLLHRAVETPVGRGVLRHGFGTRVTSRAWEEPYPLSPSESAALIAPVPLLVVHGDRDTYFPVEHARSHRRVGARHGAAARGVADRTERAGSSDGFAHAESGRRPTSWTGSAPGARRRRARSPGRSRVPAHEGAPRERHGPLLGGGQGAAGVGRGALPGRRATLAALLDAVRARHGPELGDPVLGRCSYLVDEVSPGTTPHADVVVADGAVVDVLPPFAGGSSARGTDGRPSRWGAHDRSVCGARRARARDGASALYRTAHRRQPARGRDPGRRPRTPARAGRGQRLGPRPRGRPRSTADELGRRPLGDRATLVQFSSAFCAPCRATRVVLDEVAGMVDGVAHVEVDAEAHLDLVRRLDVRRTPTVLVLDADGRRARARGRGPAQGRRDRGPRARSSDASPAAMVACCERVLANVSQVEKASHDPDTRVFDSLDSVPILDAMQTVVLTKRRAVDFCRVGSCMCRMP